MSKRAVMGVDYEDEERPVETYQGLWFSHPTIDRTPLRIRTGKGVYEDELELIRLLNQPENEDVTVLCSSTVDTFIGGGGKLVCLIDDA